MLGTREYTVITYIAFVEDEQVLHGKKPGFVGNSARFSLSRHTVYVGSFISAVICRFLSRPGYLSRHIFSRVNFLLGQAFIGT